MFTILFLIVLFLVGGFVLSTVGQGGVTPPPNYAALEDTEMCAECGVKSVGTNWAHVCNECSQDWRG